MLLEQLPRLSAYDPGADGEGGLDPLGLGAASDRIANVLAPGVRARMIQPRFVTVSAVGAFAYQTLHELTADDGKTTVDIAFEWLVVEAIVRYAEQDLVKALPGSQKAARAKVNGVRLSRRTYLSGPRVFGFTGVYRPLSRDVGVLTPDDRPAANAERLVRAWENDFQLPGYVDGVSDGGKLRREITDACMQTLEKGECAASDRLLRKLAACLAPVKMNGNARHVLRELITVGEHEIRNELTAILVASPPSVDTTQRELALQLLARSSPQTQRALQAAIDYEEAATALDNTFRRFLAHTTQQHGSVISRANALQTEGLAELAPRIGDLVQKAIDSTAHLGDVGLSNEVVDGFRLFANRLTAGEFFDALIARHEQVQASKKKLSWLDQIDGNWTVRTPYRTQDNDLKDETWAHPMRLVTLARFLRETA